jgi:hypothetical protein
VQSAAKALALGALAVEFASLQYPKFGISAAHFPGHGGAKR